MSPEDRGYLVTIRETIQRIEHDVVDGEAVLAGDTRLQDRVRRGLRTIGKSAERVSAALRAQAPVPWSALDAMAEYAGDATGAWACVRDELPGIKKAVDKLLGT